MRVCVLLWCSLASLSENIGNLFSDGVGCGGGYGSPPVYSFPNKNKNKKKSVTVSQVENNTSGTRNDTHTCIYYIL